MRLIDADAIRKRLIDRQITDAFFNAVQRHEIGCIVGMVDEQPTINAVPVVRCKDCQWLNAGKNIVEEWMWCCLLSRDVSEDHFCGYGERRSDD